MRTTTHRDPFREIDLRRTPLVEPILMLPIDLVRDRL